MEDLEEPPTLEECRHELAEWARYVQGQIDTADSNIESIEAQIKAVEDKVSLHGNLKQLLGGAVATGGIFAGMASVVAGAAMGVVAAVLSADGPIRALVWRSTKKRLEQMIADAKQQRKQWLAEKEAVEAARRSIEQQLGNRRLPASEPPRLPAPTKEGRRRRRRRRSG